MILLTGTRGFIGRWLLREFEKRSVAVEILDGDILDPGTFPDYDPDMVINLAAIPPFKLGYTEYDRFEVDVLGTKNLMNFYSAAKMVFISTTDVIKKPILEHAESKLKAEGIVKKQKGSLIFRLPSVFGPDQGRPNKLIPRLIDACLNGTDVTIYNNDLREYIYVEDAVGMIADNLEATGIFRVEGFKIKNYELAEMVQTVCVGKAISDLAPDAKHFYDCLRRTMWPR